MYISEQYLNEFSFTGALVGSMGASHLTWRKIKENDPELSRIKFNKEKLEQEIKKAKKEKDINKEVKAKEKLMDVKIQYKKRSEKLADMNRGKLSSASIGGAAGGAIFGKDIAKAGKTAGKKSSEAIKKFLKDRKKRKFTVVK